MTERLLWDRDKELGRWRPDTVRLRKLTGSQPCYTIEDAIDNVIAYERTRLEAAQATADVRAERKATVDVA